MAGNLNQVAGMDMTEVRELLKAMIDKEVDNGEAIGKTQELIKDLSSESAIEALDKRMGEFEERVRESVGGMVRRTVDMDGRVVSSMEGLQNRMESYVQFFTNPGVKEVHHRHFVGRVVWVLLGMGFIIVLLGAELWRSWEREGRNERNDILWRAAMQADDSVVTRILDRLQRDYEAGAEEFRKDVVAEEERRAELYQRWWEVQQSQAKIHELENQKKKKQAAAR